MTKEISLIWDKLDGWYEKFITMLPNIILAIVILVLVFFLARGARILFRKYIFAKWHNEELKAIVSKVIQFIVLVLGFLFALSVVNLDKTVTSILAGVGVVGIAIGFAFQDIAANFISGLFMASNKPFAIGDQIEVNDIAGTIQQIRMRTTTIKTYGGNDVIIPNQQLFQNAVTNYTAEAERRVELAVGVSYDDDLEKVKQVALKAMATLDDIIQEGDKAPVILYTGFGGSSIDFEVRFWVPNGLKATWLQKRSDAVQAIKKAFDENEISIPFPIRTLDLSDAEDVLSKLSA